MIYFEQKSKSKVIWRVLSYICAGVALFLIINFSVLAFYAKKQRSLEQEQTRIEQKIGKQLIDREITKLEKEKQEAELQKQTEERLKAEKEAEEAKAEIARKNKEQEEEMKRQQQVLAAQQIATEKEAERQAEALREQQRQSEEQQSKQKEIEKCKAQTETNKSKAINEYETAHLKAVQNLEEFILNSYNECIEQIRQQSENINDYYFLRDFVSAGKAKCIEVRDEMRYIKTENLESYKKQRYAEIEQKYQEESQKCLN